MSGSEATGSNLTSVVSNANRLPWLRCVEGCVIEDENSEVVLLTCFHSICKEECKKKFLSQGDSSTTAGKLYCKICKLLVDRADLDQKVVLSKVFTRKKDINDVVLKCGKCTRDEKVHPVMAYCSDCAKCLCDVCKQNKRYDPVCQSHTFQEDLEPLKHEALNKLLIKDLYCEAHGKSIKCFYCIQCARNMCKECRTDHDGHEIRVLQDGLEYLTTKGDNARKLLEKCESAEKELEEKRQQLQSEKEAADSRIEQAFAWMESELKQRKKQLQESAESLYSVKCNELKGKVLDVSIARAKALTISEVVEEVTSRDASAAVNVAKKFAPYLGTFSELDTKIRMMYDDFVAKEQHFRFNCQGKYKLPELSTFGRIEYTQCNPETEPLIPVVFPQHPLTGTNNGGSNQNTIIQETSLRGSELGAQVSPNDPTPSTRVLPSTSRSSKGFSVQQSKRLCLRPPAGMPTLTSEVDVPVVSAPLGKRKILQGLRGKYKKRKVATYSSPCSNSSLARTRRVGRLRHPIFGKFINVKGYKPETPSEFIVPDIELCRICEKPKDEGLDFVVCTACSRRFHLRCHLPVPTLQSVMRGSWKCTFCWNKAEIDAMIPSVGLSQEITYPRLHPNNPRDFALACKFLMEMYEIPFIDTVRWFGETYSTSVQRGKVPFTLDYIRYRLNNRSRPFCSNLGFIKALRQMFMQAFITYKKIKKERITMLDPARRCFEDFRNLVEEYYPDYCHKFNDVHPLTDKYMK